MMDFDNPSDFGSAAHSWRPGRGELLPPRQRGRARFFTRRAFFIVAACLAAVSLILAMPGMATAFVMLTLGLAFPSLFAPTALLYLLTAGIPYLYATRDLETLSGPPRTARMAGGLLFAALCVAFIGLAPNLFSAEKARSIGTNLAARNVAVNIGGAARRIVITGRDPSTWRPMPAIETRICGDECRALLLSGAADWIRIVTPQSEYGKALPPNETTFVAGEGSACAAAEDARTDPIHCVLVAPPVALAPDLSIVSEDIPAPRDKPISPLAPVPGAGRTVTARQGDRDVFFRHEQILSVISAPTVVTPGFKGINSGGFEIARSEQTANAGTLKEMFAALGYGAAMNETNLLAGGSGKWSDPPTAEQINRVVSTLALPASVPLNSMQQRFIDQWVQQARSRKPVGASDIAIIQKILHDPRVTRVFFLDQLLQRKEVLAALAPQMFELLAARKLSKEVDCVRAVSNALRSAKIDDLKPFSELILSYARKGDETANPGEFATIAGRLGVGRTAPPK